MITGDPSLRPWNLSDVDALVAAWSDPTIAAGSRPPSDRSRGAARRWIAGADERERRGLAIDRVIDIEGRCVGEVGVSSIDPRRGAALVGWWVAAEARSRGVATAAVTAFGDWALGDGGLRALVAEIDARNQASLRVAELAGFTPLPDPTGTRPGAMVRYRVD